MRLTTRPVSRGALGAPQAPQRAASAAGVGPVLGVGAELAVAALLRLCALCHAPRSSALSTVRISRSAPSSSAPFRPSGGSSESDGTVDQGQVTGKTPLYIFPIVPGAQSSTGRGELVQNAVHAAVQRPDRRAAAVPAGAQRGGRPAEDRSTAARTYKITLKSGLKWSNGSRSPAGRRVRHRPAEGRGQGERGQLGSVHPRPVPGERHQREAKGNTVTSS